MKNKRIISKTALLFIAIVITIGSCNKEDPGLPDYGMEEGYFYWYEDDEKLWLKRDRNHLSIRFYEEYGKDFHDSILAAYGIQTVWAQTFGSNQSHPGYYRVTKKPAEEYYTSYGKITLERLGNLPEVEYVLPVFYKDEVIRVLRLLPEIPYTFYDALTNERKSEILDSLITYDNLLLEQLFPGEEFPFDRFYITKSSPACPYTLYHRYYETGYFKGIEMSWIYAIDRP